METSSRKKRLLLCFTVSYSIGIINILIREVYFIYIGWSGFTWKHIHMKGVFREFQWMVDIEVSWIVGFFYSIQSFECLWFLHEWWTFTMGTKCQVFNRWNVWLIILEMSKEGMKKTISGILITFIFHLWCFMEND